MYEHTNNNNKMSKGNHGEEVYEIKNPNVIFFTPFLCVMSLIVQRYRW